MELWCKSIPAHNKKTVKKIQWFMDQLLLSKHEDVLAV
jgi:hypothetical protein